MSFSHAASAGWYLAPSLGCFDTKPQARNAYFVYDNPDAHSYYPHTVCYKDSYTDYDSFVDFRGHCTNRNTGSSTYSAGS